MTLGELATTRRLRVHGFGLWGMVMGYKVGGQEVWFTVWVVGWTIQVMCTFGELATKQGCRVSGFGFRA